MTLSLPKAEFVVQHVKERISSGEYDPSRSVALIYRTNAQSRALEEACVQNNLPYVVFGSATSFYKRQEIKDTLCFLRWIYKGDDRPSMLRCMRTPARGIGDVAISEFDAYCSDVAEYVANHYPSVRKPTPLDVLLSFTSANSFGPGAPAAVDLLSKRSLRLFADFSREIAVIRDVAHQQPVEKVVRAVVTTCDLIKHLDKISKSKTEFEERQANLQELQKAAKRYDNDGPALLPEKERLELVKNGEFQRDPLGNFLDDVALVTDVADSFANAAREGRLVVNLMTIHASKGMEYDTVFVVGNEDGTLPLFKALVEGDASLEEERRLCYVAMTRAKTELILTWRKEVMQFSKDGVRKEPGIRSRFLDPLVSSKQNKTVETTASTTGTAPRRRTAVAQNVLAGKTGHARRGKTPNGWSNRQYWSGSQKSRSTENASTKKQTFDGTTSLYKKPSSSLVETLRLADPRFRNLAVPRHDESRPTRLERSKEAPTRSRKDEKRIDSTWFYPVGSEVSHSRHGKGIVLPPPQPPELPQGLNTDLPVRVRFSDGSQLDFCARGSDLLPF
jgi:ATP-dependent exoDNAse (exonuclease V) beta subunit